MLIWWLIGSCKDLLSENWDLVVVVGSNDIEICMCKKAEPRFRLDEMFSDIISKLFSMQWYHPAQPTCERSRTLRCCSSNA